MWRAHLWFMVVCVWGCIARRCGWLGIGKSFWLWIMVCCVVIGGVVVLWFVGCWYGAGWNGGL
jgi:hypothetical protein